MRAFNILSSSSRPLCTSNIAPLSFSVSALSVAPLTSSSCAQKLLSSSLRCFASAPYQQVADATSDAEYNRLYDLPPPRSQRSDRRSSTSTSQRYSNNNKSSSAYATDSNNNNNNNSDIAGRLGLSTTSSFQPAPVSEAPLPSSSSYSILSLNPDDYPIDPLLKHSLKKNFAIKEFFPIQAECYLPIAEGKDLIGRSKTGTGKTLAFVLPLLERIKRMKLKPLRSEISVLIMEPTRELANQVCQEIHKLNPFLNVVSVYGGVGYGQQQAGLAKGADIVVGTPGRLMDLLEKGYCTLKETSTVVLDEADEMLRRGFREDIETIMGYITKPERQTLLFSATLPPFIRNITQNYQRDAVIVDKIEGEDNTTPSTISHEAITAPRLLVDRMRLIGALANSVSGRVICFVNAKRDADTIVDYEYKDDLGVSADVLHGDVSQARRDATMAAFKAGKFKLLVSILIYTYSMHLTHHLYSHLIETMMRCCHARQMNLDGS